LPAELPPREKKLTRAIKYAWEEPFEEPMEPYTEHIEYEYLDKLID